MATSKIQSLINNDIGTYTVAVIGATGGGFIRWPYNFQDRHGRYTITLLSATASVVGPIDHTKISVQASTGFVIFYSSDATLTTYDDRIVEFQIQVS